ncbi:hypothetical protein BCR37DRAFT_348887, partial [Protomyces lactucae-debilis]
EVVLVTGAAAGLGFCVKQKLRQKGARVVALDVVDCTLSDYYKCDVSDADAVAKTAEAIKASIGVPTVVVSNAGIVRPGTVLASSLDDIKRTLDINLLGQFILAKAFLPDMLDHEGQWVTVGSTLGYVGCHSLASYTASKAAVLSFHESLTAELAESHPRIATTLVLPGQMSESMFAKLSTPNSFLAPVAELEKVADCIVELIERRQPGEFAMPLYGRFLGILRVLPSGLQQLARRFSGMDGAAQSFSSLAAAETKRKA